MASRVSIEPFRANIVPKREPVARKMNWSVRR